MSEPGALSLIEALDLTDDAIVIFDDKSLIAAANARFRSVFAGVEVFTRPGTPLDILVMEIARRGHLNEASIDAIRLAEAEIMDFDRAVDPVEIRDANGRLWQARFAATSAGGFAVTLREIPDRERAAAEAAEAEQLMAKVLEACPDRLVMARVGDGQILYRSPAATALLGTLKNLNTQFAHRTERADFITALLAEGSVDDMRIEAFRPNGDLFQAEISARLIDYRGDDVVVASIQDMTGALAVEAELAHQKDLTFQSEKLSALGELLAGVAHELNNPLSIVVGNAMMLKEEDLDSAMAERVDKLGDAAERCVRIVRMFLSMVRERPLEISTSPVSELLLDARDAYYADSADSPVEVSIDIPESLPDLPVDAAQITRVLTNLFINAQHAIDDSGVGGTVRVTARHDAENARIVIFVADDGPGIPDDIRSKIFDPLFTTKPGGKGTGMGLSLCHRIVHGHDGTIRLGDAHAVGTVFEIALPLS